ncbi:DUF1156 domain-containing protein [Cerasicoccus arenae]|uniref:DUF1156 domain-containing protein n=1 Tax=Cerasicoccus arenae TaxID=424488 RepID=A0A8J3DIK7_9BACT|nr:DUF1156 domain-containing protein [Cerasicoccus arenae]MBK1857776.1 DUF1156 domain-containing protein [Cerasicoccus arenae]GHC11991.1 hypothetical protein GCM10007047_31720 [Cerasicoccus arenae]
MKPTKKLIETVIPLAEINDASAYDKMPGIGAHPKGIHHWWARLPLPCARAVLFASVVDDPCSIEGFEELPKPEKDKRLAEREYLHNLIIRLLDKKPHERPEVFEEARRVIEQACDGKMPEVLDPFTGGGSIPLEAQRLGFQAHGRDLNPVPALITKATIDYPVRFADHPPVNPDSPKKMKWTRARGLAEDVRYYGNRMLEEARKRIGHLYPKLTLPAEYGGGEADVIAWIWARTVKSPNPAFSKVDVPLISNYVLSSKKGKEAYLEPIIEGDSYRFEVKQGKAPQGYSDGTKLGRGANFHCLLSKAPMSPSYIKQEGSAGRMGQRLIAIVADGGRQRVYLPACPEHERVAASANPEWYPSQKINYDPRNIWVPPYGLNCYGDLFTARQLNALTTLSDLIAITRSNVEYDGGARDYANAIATFLACSVDRVSDFNNSLTGWGASNEKVMHLFGRQAIPMAWDFAEANTLNEVVGGWKPSYEYTAKCIQTCPITPSTPGQVKQQDAADTKWPPQSIIISTDPPYYDNISYADLSDFFYVWLRRSLRDVHPELLSTLLTPKTEELIASPYRHGDKDKAKEHFESGFRDAFTGMKHALDPRFPLTVYYAMKQTESDSDVKGGPSGRQSGWETLLESLIQSGFQITATWPVRASQKWRMVGMGTNALASYVVLACRLRPESALTGTRIEFLRELDRELPPALRQLQEEGIPAVDLAQAILGPAMAIYSRYQKIIEADGERMPVSSALDLINQRLGEMLSGIEAELDRASQWAVAWFESFGHAAAEAGEADGLCRSKGVSLEGLRDTGIIHAGGGKVRLLRRDEMSEEWLLAPGGKLTDWGVCQQMIATQEKQGNEGLAKLIKQAGSHAESGRALAYRLYDVCERKGWAKDATPYNVLVTAWGDAQRLTDKMEDFKLEG